MHVLNWLKYKILYKIVVFLVAERKEKCKFQIWKFTRSFVWRAVSDWFMMFLGLLLNNKPISNDYFSWIDEWSVGWREEIECWNSICRRTSMTVGKLMNMSLVYLVCFITILIWNNWFEGIDWCWPSTTWNVNWFFGFHWRRCRTSCKWVILYVFSVIHIW